MAWPLWGTEVGDLRAGWRLAVVIGVTNYPGGLVFYVDSNVVNGQPNDPDFLGDTGIPTAAGHYSSHPAPGVSDNIQVSFRPAK